MLFHVLLILLMTFSLTLTPRPSVSSEKTAEVGIALKSFDGEKTLYESPESLAEEEESAAAETVLPEIHEEAALSEIQSMVASQATPEIPTIPTPHAGLPPSSGDGIRGLENVTRGLSGAGALGGGALGGFGGGKVSCFNTTGNGNRFAFVFDRSGSMWGPRFSPIMAAKSELIRSLQSLRPNQQFHIIFYNEEPLSFSDGLMLATVQNRRRAMNFLASIEAEGGTDHKAALHAAIALHPDVIFFLTDADEPPLTDFELREIRRNAAGTQINTIQFGSGPRVRGGNFLTRLAKENGGQYVYIDIQKLTEIE